MSAIFDMQEYKKLSTMTRLGIERARRREQHQKGFLAPEDTVQSPIDQVEPFYPAVEWSTQILDLIADLADLEPAELRNIQLDTKRGAEVYDYMAERLLEIGVIVESGKQKRKKGRLSWKRKSKKR